MIIYTNLPDAVKVGGDSNIGGTSLVNLHGHVICFAVGGRHAAAAAAAYAVRAA